MRPPVIILNDAVIATLYEGSGFGSEKGHRHHGKQLPPMQKPSLPI